MNTQRLQQLIDQLLARLRSPWVAGTLILFLLVYGVLLISYLSKRGELSDLRERSQSSRLIDIAGSDRTRQQIALAKEEFEAIQEGIPPGDLTEIDIFRTLRILASEIGFKTSEVSIDLQGTVPQKKVGNTTFKEFSIHMTASGTSDEISTLVEKLDQGETPFKTLVLDKLNLSFSGRTSTANMDFKIYTKAAGG